MSGTGVWRGSPTRDADPLYRPYSRGRWLRTRWRNCLARDRGIAGLGRRFWTVEWLVGRDDRVTPRGDSLVPERRPRDPGVRPLAMLGAVIAVTTHVATREAPIVDY